MEETRGTQYPKYSNDDDEEVALIVGVTGMAGLSLAEALKNHPSTSHWQVYGVSRRPLPGWFPPSLLDGGRSAICLDALDRNDTAQKLSTIAHRVTHLFWVALQQTASEETNVSLNSTMLRNVLDVLVSADYTENTPIPNLPSRPRRPRHVTIQTGTKHYLGPIFDPSLEGKLVLHSPDPPFHEDSPRLPYPNFYHALEDLVASYSAAHGFSYSVHRSSIIVGASTRSTHNGLLNLCVYAAICKHLGLPFRYLGSKYTWDHFVDMSDARLLAEHHIWAATSEKAKNQTFNCTNGDVFTWKAVWRVLAEELGLEVVVDEAGIGRYELNWVEVMKHKGHAWDEIVDKYGLFRTELGEITCYQAQDIVTNFKFQHVCSMNKSKEFGFLGYVDTLKGIRMWVRRLQDMKIIPSI